MVQKKRMIRRVSSLVIGKKANPNRTRGLTMGGRRDFYNACGLETWQ